MLDKTWIHEETIDLLIGGQSCSIYTDFLIRELNRERISCADSPYWEGIMKVNNKDWRLPIKLLK